MTNNREEQIYKAADKATYQTPPQYSELVHKSRKVMCAYETGFIDWCVWADSNPNWIPVEDRLPNENTAPLVRMDLTDKFGEETILYDVAVFDGNGFHTPYKVTHWQEIVPPRNEE